MRLEHRVVASVLILNVIGQPSLAVASPERLAATIQPTSRPRSTAREIAAFTWWKLRIEELVRDLKAAHPKSDPTLRKAKWLYDDAWASVNGLLAGIVSDLRGGSVPAGDRPYHASIREADDQVTKFVNFARDTLFPETDSSEKEKHATAAPVLPVIVGVAAFVEAALPIIDYAIRLSNSDSGSDIRQQVEELEALKLRPFDEI